MRPLSGMFLDTGGDPAPPFNADPHAGYEELPRLRLVVRENSILKHVAKQELHNAPGHWHWEAKTGGHS